MVKKSSAKTKARPSAASKEPVQLPSESPPVPALSVKAQQRLLDIYSETFSSVLKLEKFPDLLQEIKQALFERDFATAFGREDFLEAYAARWSPTRSLGYASIIQRLEDYISRLAFSEGEALPGKSDAEPTESSEELDRDIKPCRTLRVLCLGGCAAELAAFAHFLGTTSLVGDLNFVDSAPWSASMAKLQQRLTNPPTLSPYASAAAKASNHALVPPNQLNMSFHQQDILSIDDSGLQAHVGTDHPVLVTLLFTLNELYTGGGIARTTKFLGSLGQKLPSGSLLLVVDSPGSYSEAAIGKEKKRYPMAWLLDHTLLQKSPQGVTWEKLESEDSTWFRLPDDYKYPMQLENMRYQLHLYKVVNT